MYFNLYLLFSSISSDTFQLQISSLRLYLGSLSHLFFQEDKIAFFLFFLVPLPLLSRHVLQKVFKNIKMIFVSRN